MNVKNESKTWHIFLKMVDEAAERAHTDEDYENVEIAYKALGVEVVDG